MSTPLLVSTPKPYTTPLLVVDREGTLGQELVSVLQETYLTVFVSAVEPPVHKNLIHIPFKKKIPVIPDNTFSHIFLFFHGEKELAQALPAFIQKAKESQATLVLAFPLSFYNDQLAKHVLSLYPKTTILVLGDIFSQPVMPSSPVTNLLFAAKTYGRVELANSGLDEIYPVALSDVIEGIIAVVFAPHTDGGIFALYPKHPPTQLSFCRLLQQAYPLLRVDFVKRKETPKHVSLPHDPLFVFGPDYPLATRLKRLDLSHTPLARAVHSKKKRSSRPPAPPWRKTVFLALSLFFFLVSLPLLLSVGFSFGGGLFLVSAENQLRQGNIPRAYDAARAATSLFGVADQSVNTLQAVVQLAGLQQEVVGFRTTINSGSEVASALEEGLSGAVLVQAVIHGQSAQPKQDFLTAVNKVKEALTLLQQLQAEDALPPALKNKLQPFQAPLALALNTIDATPQLLGFQRLQTYLVLFQNNFELRPSGGFIGSYGIAKVQNGRLLSFTIHDVYDADGKLATHVEPPFALRRYMGASHWFMRDSNYAVDFPTAAAEVAGFLQKETGEKVDGVITVDMSFLTSLLSATGPLPLPDYHETLTPENAYLVTENHVEKNFFPGSTQKKDFLHAVQKAIDQKIASHHVSYAKLPALLTQAIAQKHLLVAFADPSLQQLFTVNGLSSALWDNRTADPTIVRDFFAVNEANIGQNKDNYYLKRSIDQSVTIDGEGKVTDTISLTYTNMSTKTSPFGGDYKAYTRVLVPLHAVLTQVSVNNVLQHTFDAVTDPRVFTAKQFVPPPGMEIETASESGKEAFGFLLTVPVQITKTITLSYQLPDALPLEKPTTTYDLRIFKQPGTLSDPYKLTVSYPLASRVFSSSAPITDLGGKFVFEKPVSEDFDLSVSFVSR